MVTTKDIFETLFLLDVLTFALMQARVHVLNQIEREGRLVGDAVLIHAAP